jgi:hypothetical protein
LDIEVEITGKYTNWGVSLSTYGVDPIGSGDARDPKRPGKTRLSHCIQELTGVYYQLRKTPGPKSKMNASRSLWNRGPLFVTNDEGHAQSKLSDCDLAQRFCGAGDADSFAEIFRRHRRPVYSACLAFLGQSAAAEDAT